MESIFDQIRKLQNKTKPVLTKDEIINIQKYYSLVNNRAKTCNKFKIDKVTLDYAINTHV